jgi:glutamyl/glutaminyl-tRNA synthetase
MYSVGLNSDFDFQNIASDEFNDFDLSKISKNLPKLDIKKIDYFQKNSLRLMTNSGLSYEFPELSQLEITNKEWDLIRNNIDNYEDINEFLDIIRRKKIENKPAKEFVDILVSNIEKIKTMNFDGYINFLTNHELKLSKKDIFTNTRYILTGNKNGPSVKDLFLFFGAEGIEKIINEFETF